ncbi:MAG: hypothetical protein Q7R93_02325 [bacterium]|nr:hypothetical protein [bacterium]
MEERLEHLENQVKTIVERNARVEADKAWERSWFRTLSIAVVTYAVAAVLLYFIVAMNVFLAALVPAVGFILSVQSLPALKRWWIARFFKKQS